MYTCACEDAEDVDFSPRPTNLSLPLYALYTLHSCSIATSDLASLTLSSSTVAMKCTLSLQLCGGPEKEEKRMGEQREQRERGEERESFNHSTNRALKHMQHVQLHL